jgi:DNA-binding NtrC family response regulator
VKLGALDYLRKPFELKRLGGLLTGVCKNIERRERLLQADAEVARTFAFYGMIGRSPAMQELFDAIRRFARLAPRSAICHGELLRGGRGAV